ncbi:hypothetical protein Ancab_000872 [Ancistrocladus abbreviatus]
MPCGGSLVVQQKYCFKDEDSISLLTIIKGTRKYRHSQRVDYVSDFLPPSMSEFNHAFDRVYGFVYMLPFALSLTRGLVLSVSLIAGRPGPVLLLNGSPVFMGEAYKLLWPDEPEFVRMAARSGATIVPSEVVGEDDLLELVLDYDDQMRIPIWNEYLRHNSGGMTRASCHDLRGHTAMPSK